LLYAASVRPRTIETLRERLRHALAAFGDAPLTDLERMSGEIASWRARLPKRRRYDIVQALRQTLEASNALAAGVSVFELGRIMGTSVAMIERHYGTLIEGAGADIARRLDAFEAEHRPAGTAPRTSRPLSGHSEPLLLVDDHAQNRRFAGASWRAGGGIRTPDPRFTRAVLWPTELLRR
jgi:hypothetical protein